MGPFSALEQEKSHLRVDRQAQLQAQSQAGLKDSDHSRCMKTMYATIINH